MRGGERPVRGTIDTPVDRAGGGERNRRETRSWGAWAGASSDFAGQWGRTRVDSRGEAGGNIVRHDCGVLDPTTEAYWLFPPARQ